MEAMFSRYGMGHFGAPSDSSAFDEPSRASGSKGEAGKGGSSFKSGYSPFTTVNGKARNAGGVETQGVQRSRATRARGGGASKRDARGDRPKSDVLFPQGGTTSASKAAQSRRPLKSDQSIEVLDELNNHDDYEELDGSTVNKGKARVSIERSRSPQKAQPFSPPNKAPATSSEEEVEMVEPSRKPESRSARNSRPVHDAATRTTRTRQVEEAPTKQLGTQLNAKPLGSTNGELRRPAPKGPQSVGNSTIPSKSAAPPPESKRPHKQAAVVQSSNLQNPSSTSSNISSMYAYLGSGEIVAARKIPAHRITCETGAKGLASISIDGPIGGLNLCARDFASFQYSCLKERSYVAVGLRHAARLPPMIVESPWCLAIELKAGFEQVVTNICKVVDAPNKRAEPRPPDVMSRMWQELLQRHQQGDLPQERRADKGSGNSPKQAAAVKGSSKRERTIVVTDSGSESDEYNPPIDIKKNAKLVKKKELDVAGANGQRDIKTFMENTPATRTSKRIKQKTMHTDSSAFPDQEAPAEHLSDNEVTARPQRHVPRPADPQAVLFPYPLSGPARLTITAGDKYRLPSDDFLNDTLLEFGLSHVIEEARGKQQQIHVTKDHLEGTFEVGRDVHLFNSFFYERLQTRATELGKLDSAIDDSGNWLPYKSVSKWTKSAEIFKKRLIIVPINEHAHWYLAIIYNPAGILRKSPTGHAPVQEDQNTAASTPAPESRRSARGSEAEEEEDEEEEEIEVKQPNPMPEVDQRDLNPRAVSEDHEEPSEQDVCVVSEPSSPMTPSSPDPIDCIPDLPAGPAASRDDKDLAIIETTRQLSRANMTSSEDAVRNEAASEDVDMEAEERDDSTPVTEPGKHAKPEGTPYTIPAQTFYGTRGAIEAEKAALVPADDTAVASSFGAKISGAVPWEEFIERPECRRKILVSDDTWIITLDSLGGSHRPVTDLLGRWLVSEARARQHVDLSVKTTHHQSREAPVPQQPNFSDCGLYLIHFTERLVNDLVKVLGFIELERKRFTRHSGHHERYDDLLSTVWDAKATSGLRDLWTAKIDSLASEYRRNREERAGRSDDQAEDAPSNSQEGDSVLFVDAQGSDVAERGQSPVPPAAEIGLESGEDTGSTSSVSGKRQTGGKAVSNPFQLAESGVMEEEPAVAPRRSARLGPSLADSDDEDAESIEGGEMSGRREADDKESDIAHQDQYIANPHASDNAASKPWVASSVDAGEARKLKSATMISVVDSADTRTEASSDHLHSSDGRTGEQAGLVEEQSYGRSTLALISRAPDNSNPSALSATALFPVPAEHAMLNAGTVGPDPPAPYPHFVTDVSDDDIDQAQREVEEVQNGQPASDTAEEAKSSPLFPAMKQLSESTDLSADVDQMGASTSAGIDAPAGLNPPTTERIAITSHSPHGPPDLIGEATQSQRLADSSARASGARQSTGARPAILPESLDLNRISRYSHSIAVVEQADHGDPLDSQSQSGQLSALDRLRQVPPMTNGGHSFDERASAKRPDLSQAESGRSRKKTKPSSSYRPSPQLANASRPLDSSPRASAHHDEFEIDLGERIDRDASVLTGAPARPLARRSTPGIRPDQPVHCHSVSSGDEDDEDDRRHSDSMSRGGRLPAESRPDAISEQTTPTKPNDTTVRHQARVVAPRPFGNARNSPQSTPADPLVNTITMSSSDDEYTDLHPAVTSAHKMGTLRGRGGQGSRVASRSTPPSTANGALDGGSDDVEVVPESENSLQAGRNVKRYGIASAARLQRNGPKPTPAADKPDAFSGNDISPLPVSEIVPRPGNMTGPTADRSGHRSRKGRDLDDKERSHSPIATSVSPGRHQATNEVYDVSSGEDEGAPDSAKRAAAESPQRSGTRAKRAKGSFQQSTLPASHTPHAKSGVKRPASKPNANDTMAKKAATTGRRSRA